MDDIAFQQLLTYLHLSWKGYRKVRKGVKKRISRHMQETGCRTMDEYVHLLNSNPQIKAQCQQLMMVTISRFLRDIQLWQSCESFLIHELLERIDGNFIHVWSAGCACGEEPYSLRIIWDQLQATFSSKPRLQILATDSNPDNLNRAKKALYLNSSLKEVPEPIKKKYFIAKKGGRKYELRNSLKSDIYWKEHHLLSPPPQSLFHIIFLRNNLLTYYKNDLKVPAFENILNQLHPSGLLILGSHENIPPECDCLVRDERCKYVYIKKIELEYRPIG